MFRAQRSTRSSLLIGLAVITIGVVLLLDQLGVISQWKIFRFWPLLLILVGLRQIIRCSRWAGRMVGVFFLVLGGVFLLDNLGYDRVRIETVWPVFVILGGILLIMRSAESPENRHAWAAELRDKWKGDKGGTPIMDSRLNQVSIFGGGEYRIDSKNFQGGEVTAIFGGFEIDLSQADIGGEEAVIDATAIFGGGELRVPESWLVSVEGVGIFGGFEDKTRHPQPDAAGPRKHLIVRGTAIFGGMEIKN